MPRRRRDAIDELFARGTPVDEAIREAVMEAVLAHRRAGRPVVIWRNGRVVELRGEEIDRELARESASLAPSADERLR